LTSVAEQVGRCARLIARVYGVRAVIFGHTHESAGRWDSGVFYGNSGTWVPMYHDIACSIPIEESRPVIWLRQEADRLVGGLYRFHDGKLHLCAGSQRPEEQRPPLKETAPLGDADGFSRRVRLPVYSGVQELAWRNHEQTERS
jgi:hypothetical protein